MRLESFVRGSWMSPGHELAQIHSAVTGDVVAEVANGGLDMGEVLAYARQVGGPALRRLTFHQRAEMLKRLAIYLSERKDQLYKLSYQTGTTRTDNFIDVDGGIGTLFVYASKGRRELPNTTFLLDGNVEPLSKGGSFVGQHVMTPLTGVAVHINAFNFPCWGMLEKLAPAILAGVPVVTKPATITSYVAHALVRMIAESRILPEGALQCIVGSTGDLFDHLTCQDVVSFTGSADTAQKLQRHPVIARESVRFIAERDSLNAAILAPDAGPGTPEFDLFIKEVAKEMTVKAGQKCTAIRRAIAPNEHVPAVIAALGERLSKIKVGNPELESVRMGPVVGLGQRRDVLAQVAKLRSEADIVVGDPDNFAVEGADRERGAFLPPLVLHCPDPIRATNVHSVEAFGPVCTVMGYDGLDQAVALANRGDGSLVASLYTYDPAAAADLVFGVGAFHGRLVLIDRDCAKEQTGHGSPMPHMVHGGPGRAGGGEELGGIRGVHHYMQRTALQGSPAMLSRVTQSWIKGAPIVEEGSPSLPLLLRGSRDRPDLRLEGAHDHAGGHRAFRGIHRRYLLCAYERGGDEEPSVLPRPRRPWLPASVLRSRPFRRSGSRAGACQLRSRFLTVHQARAAGRDHQGPADGEIEIAAQRAIRRGALGCGDHDGQGRDGCNL